MTRMFNINHPRESEFTNKVQDSLEPYEWIELISTNPEYMKYLERHEIQESMDHIHWTKLYLVSSKIQRTQEKVLELAERNGYYLKIFDALRVLVICKNTSQNSPWTNIYNYRIVPKVPVYLEFLDRDFQNLQETMSFVAKYWEMIPGNN